MKKFLLITTVLIAFICSNTQAQTVVDFEELVVPDEGFYNGSTDHSGIIGSTETFWYEDEAANLYVVYTLEDGFDYWSGFAYSNQTDLVTADWTNYSAYSELGGGANGSSNYIISYVWSDSLMFDNSVDISSMNVTNSVWAYHYMNGTDGIGTGTFTTGDYFTISITGIREDGSYTDPLDFHLADFTNGNDYIIDDWTEVDLSGLGNVSGLKFGLSSSDVYTPYYFCLDNLVYSDVSSIKNKSVNSFQLYPNPANDHIHLTNIQNTTVILSDIKGRSIMQRSACNFSETFDISELSEGIYFINIYKGNSVYTKKLVKH